VATKPTPKTAEVLKTIETLKRGQKRLTVACLFLTCLSAGLAIWLIVVQSQVGGMRNRITTGDLAVVDKNGNVQMEVAGGETGVQMAFLDKVQYAGRNVQGRRRLLLGVEQNNQPYVQMTDRIEQVEFLSGTVPSNLTFSVINTDLGGPTLTLYDPLTDGVTGLSSRNLLGGSPLISGKRQQLFADLWAKPK
jgi:hypothetical protein